MSFEVCDRWGHCESEASADRMREILAQLDASDPEHPDVALAHESGWSLSVFPSGLMVWENAEEESEPRHMCDVPRDRALSLWLTLAAGHIAEIDAEPWQPGSQ